MTCAFGLTARPALFALAAAPTPVFGAHRRRYESFDNYHRSGLRNECRASLETGYNDTTTQPGGCGYQALPIRADLWKHTLPTVLRFGIGDAAARTNHCRCRYHERLHRLGPPCRVESRT